jgi:uncharacterized protein (DUF488 family)
MQTTVYTIGHSSHPIDRFIWLLRHNDIAVIADVRSIPASRHNPQYNRDTLRRSLGAAGITYVHMGEQLGAMTEDPDLMENGRVSFARIAASRPFITGLSRVADVARKHRIALMCAEKDPLSCHRTILVSRQLDKAGVAVEHILEDGTREHHSNTMTRLLKATRTPEEDIFLSREDLIDQAVAKWEEKMLGKRT